MNQELARQGQENQGVAHLRKMPTSAAFKDKLLKLHKDVPVDSYLTAVNIVVNQNPAIQRCTPQSILTAVTEAFRHRLQLGGPMAEAYLVPYKTTCRFMLGYRGMITLAARHGVATTVYAHCVYPHDDFDCSLGDSPRLIHKPNYFHEQRDEDMMLAYAVATLPDGTKQFTIMPRADIDKVRGVSQTGNRSDSPWSQWFPAMAQKSAIRRLFKQLPTPDSTMTRVLADDDAVERGERPSYAADEVESLEIGASTSHQLETMLAEPEAEPEPEETETVEPEPKKRRVRKKEAEPEEPANEGVTGFSLLEQCGILFAEVAESKSVPLTGVSASACVATLARRLEIEWPNDDREQVRRVYDEIGKCNIALVVGATREFLNQKKE